MTPAALGPVTAPRERTAAAPGTLRDADPGGAPTATGGPGLIAYALVDAGSADRTGTGRLLAGAGGAVLPTVFAEAAVLRGALLAGAAFAAAATLLTALPRRGPSPEKADPPPSTHTSL